MVHGDLYPKGKTVWCRAIGMPVEYICCAGDGLHIVLAPPLDFLDDRVREVRSDQLLDETVFNMYEKEVIDGADHAEFFAWVRENQSELRRVYQRKYGHLLGPDDLEQKFLFFAIYRYEVHRMAAQLAPTTHTCQ